MKYYIILLFFSCLYSSLAATRNATSKIMMTTSTNRIMYNLLVTLLKTCDLDLKKIIIYDDTFESEILPIIVHIQPEISVLLFSDPKAVSRVRRYQADDWEFDALIFVIRLNDDWFMMKYFFLQWRYNRNCIIYLIPVPISACNHWKSPLEWLMRFYFSTVYYICFQNHQYIRVVTHDPYGDTNPPHWKKIHQEHLWSKNWYFYTRQPITNDTAMSKLCPGFLFKRTDPSNQEFVISGIHEYKIGPKLVKGKNFYGAEIEKDFKQPYRDRVPLLKRLLKVQFKYYKMNTVTDGYVSTGIDLVLFSQTMPLVHVLMGFFHPVEYEPYIIISHDRGFMTPLEKIAKFYGIWTLASLTVMLTMTFVVIRIVTKNIRWAFFDVIRLLINTGIIIPINTRPLKIFFCTVFLYFLIIHATFSGHLAEFLTKVVHRSNVETLDDLKDPRIEKIYYFGYWENDATEDDVLLAKLIHLNTSIEFSKVIDKTTCAYIVPLAVSDQIWRFMKGDNILHTSKNTFGLSFISSSYKKGFPLSNKFDWAFMYLFDTGFITLLPKEYRWEIFYAISRQRAISYVHHRPITLDDLHFAFMILITGNCVSFVSFFVEINLENIRKKLQNLRHKTSRHIVRIDIQPY